MTESLEVPQLLIARSYVEPPHPVHFVRLFRPWLRIELGGIFVEQKIFLSQVCGSNFDEEQTNMNNPFFYLENVSIVNQSFLLIYLFAFFWLHMTWLPFPDFQYDSKIWSTKATRLKLSYIFEKRMSYPSVEQYHQFLVDLCTMWMLQQSDCGIMSKLR